MSLHPKKNDFNIPRQARSSFEYFLFAVGTSVFKVEREYDMYRLSSYPKESFQLSACGLAELQDPDNISNALEALREACLQRWGGIPANLSELGAAPLRCQDGFETNTRRLAEAVFQHYRDNDPSLTDDQIVNFIGEGLYFSSEWVAYFKDLVNRDTQILLGPDPLAALRRGAKLKATSETYHHPNIDRLCEERLPPLRDSQYPSGEPSNVKAPDLRARYELIFGEIIVDFVRTRLGKEKLTTAICPNIPLVDSRNDVIFANFGHFLSVAFHTFRAIQDRKNEERKSENLEPHGPFYTTPNCVLCEILRINRARLSGRSLSALKFFEDRDSCFAHSEKLSDYRESNPSRRKRRNGTYFNYAISPDAARTVLHELCVQLFGGIPDNFDYLTSLSFQAANANESDEVEYVSGETLVIQARKIRNKSITIMSDSDLRRLLVQAEIRRLKGISNSITWPSGTANSPTQAKEGSKSNSTPSQPRITKDEICRSVVQEIGVPDVTLFFGLCSLGLEHDRPKLYESFRETVKKKAPQDGTGTTPKDPIATLKSLVDLADPKHLDQLKTDEIALENLVDLLKQLCYRCHDGDYKKMIAEMKALGSTEPGQ
ncbi:MAG: hypothetical protein KDD42_09705, partial [Bdellovibrionales bacterium]|nr:hypothetical protein [Bdellovibrionales bacterium]